MLVATKGDESREVIRHHRGVWWCPFDDHSNTDALAACGKCGAVSSDEEASVVASDAYAFGALSPRMQAIVDEEAAETCQCKHAQGQHATGPCQYRRHCGCEVFLAASA